MFRLLHRFVDGEGGPIGLGGVHGRSRNLEMVATVEVSRIVVAAPVRAIKGYRAILLQLIDGSVGAMGCQVNPLSLGDG